MNRRQLLRSGGTVSEIGLGCLGFAGFYGPATEAESRLTLAAAVDLGIDFFDTANIYGMGVSERILGGFLRTLREPVTVATKAGIRRDRDGRPRDFDNRPEHLRAELEGSLRRLGRDRVELFYVHRRDPDVPVEEVMGTLLALKREGKIGGIGFSEIAPATLRRACAEGPVDAVQSEYSLWTRQPELGLARACAELGVALVPYAPLARGMLGAARLDPAAFAEGDFRRTNPRFLEPAASANLARADAFRALAAECGTTAPVLALAWLLSRGERVVPIPGTRSAAHLRDCAAASGFVMSDEILAGIERVLPPGWAEGDRYSRLQWNGPEGYC